MHQGVLMKPVEQSASNQLGVTAWYDTNRGRPARSLARKSGKQTIKEDPVKIIVIPSGLENYAYALDMHSFKTNQRGNLSANSP